MTNASYDEIELQYEDVERQLADPEVISDQKKYKELSQRYTELKEFVEKYRLSRSLRVQKSDAEDLLDDPEMNEIAKEELASIDQQLVKIDEELQLFLVPKDPNDHRNAIVEIRQGTGGDEAALFAEDLLKMYQRYSERRGWNCEIISQHLTEIGGIKEVSFTVSGQGVYSELKYEIGTHKTGKILNQFY
tara:strand:- start:150 stop:719 length:570 start_codon:yes stop_codon:yes gene_type:complete